MRRFDSLVNKRALASKERGAGKIKVWFQRSEVAGDRERSTEVCRTAFHPARSNSGHTRCLRSFLHHCCGSFRRTAPPITTTIFTDCRSGSHESARLRGTWYWIACWSPQGKEEAAAAKIAFNLRDAGGRLVTTEEVLTEVLNYYSRHGAPFRRVAAGAVRALLASGR